MGSARRRVSAGLLCQGEECQRSRDSGSLPFGLLLFGVGGPEDVWKRGSKGEL